MAIKPIMKKMLAQLNVINWVDFHSWRKDYDLQQMYEMNQMIKQEYGRKGLDMIVVESIRSLRNDE